VVFSDALNHASLIDGCRLSRARVVVYRHGSVDELESALRRERGRRRIIVTESVFSMDGDAAPLAELVALGRAHEAITVIDDAHAFGVLGPGGRGLGWASGADIVVGTLGKSLGAAGAFVAGPASLADLLWNRARTLVFSTGLSTGTQAAALAGLQIAASDEGTTRRALVRSHASSLCAALNGSLPIGELNGSQPKGGPVAAIVPVVLGPDGLAVEASKMLEEGGFWVPAIRPPTVPDGTARLRITVAASHDAVAVERLTACVNRLLTDVFHVEQQGSTAAIEPALFHVEQR
jgi:8-amino-7-oxononanoate synthase